MSAAEEAVGGGVAGFCQVEVGGNRKVHGVTGRAGTGRDALLPT